MCKLIRLLILFAMLLSGIAILATGTTTAAVNTRVDVLEFYGPVHAPLADYIERGIRQAEEDGAEAVIIRMSTPGGLLSSTERIVNTIVHADVPVVVYVESWAGSAGTFVTLASHVAAMAPGSNIGAASPVAGGGEDISDTMQKKVFEHTAAWAESLAEMRGRNQTAARAAVIEAASYTDSQALGVHEVPHWEALGLDGPLLDPPLVDLGANNLQDLLNKLHGIEVTLHSGEVIALNTEDASLNYVDKTTIERFLMAISDPNIAYILLSIATLGIMIEMFNPGLIFPGVTGVISLFLAVYSLDILEANWAGIILIIVAFALFAAEVFTASFGLLSIGGVISLVIGSFILFSGSPFSIHPALMAAVVIFFSTIAIFLVVSVVRAHGTRITTSREGMVGEKATAITTLDPSGTVRFKGERWNAESEHGTIEAGDEVVVTKVERIKLWVSKK